MSDAQAAQRVRSDGVELLLDLQGHTRGNRLGILARRPAPVQAAFLGYPGTTGAPYIDYIVGDPCVTPTELAPLYSEQLAQMPRCFQPNGRWRPLPQPMTRAQAGLPEDAFVMCAFNHTYKILPQAFDAWCAVLRDVPRAVLWLKETNGQLHDNVHREAAARGVAPERIVFAKAVSYPDHFSRLAQADVFVDTWPYNAHTTAADALWAGVPVVTVHGNSFASRVAASVLSAAGLGELAFDNAHDYRLAITALALEPGLLAGYREHLTRQRMELELFDSQRYTREFESLLARMVQRWRDGLAPAFLGTA
jgi:predicted O-linked N-acetylglucosamine transferase (SPINDLY family)